MFVDARRSPCQSYPLIQLTVEPTPVSRPPRCRSLVDSPPTGTVETAGLYHVVVAGDRRSFYSRPKRRYPPFTGSSVAGTGRHVSSRNVSDGGPSFREPTLDRTDEPSNAGTEAEAPLFFLVALNVALPSPDVRAVDERDEPRCRLGTVVGLDSIL
jgi:hypothetical protein